ncbi:MAG: Ig domain-containing protein [Gemmataceae bacterium]
MAANASAGGAGAPAATAQTQKKPAYTRLEFKVEVKKADIWKIVDFLQAFYSVDLLHQITYISIVRENKATEARSGLDLHLTIEAIILDKAEPRKNLPEPNQPPAGVLASKTRDYSFIAWKDIFYGILPSVSPPPFTLARLDDVTLQRDEKGTEVKLKLSGDGSSGAKVVAKASGSLLPEGELSIDSKTNTITIPGAGKEDTPDGMSSTISVVATSTEGVTVERSFKVSIAKKPEPKEPEKPKIDISGAIRLVILSDTSEGITKAVIYDAANPFKFELTTKDKKVEVTRYWQATGKTWRKDRDYDQPDGVLAFADDFSATKRTFKVLAFEEGAVILSKSGPTDAKPEAPRKGGRPGSGGTAKQGPAEPLAVVAGNIATALPAPTVYRWSLGKSLQELTKVPATEAKELLKRVAADGPVLNSAVAEGK